MDDRQRKLIGAAALLCFGLLAFSSGFWAAGGRSEGTERFDGTPASGNRLIDEAYRRILSTSVDPPDDERLAEGAIRGMVNVLKRSGDPYALFYSPRAFDSFQELTTGRFSGIGVWLDSKGDSLEILSVLPESPAREVGLKPGDVIVTVDGVTVEQMPVDEAVARIKGPQGTEVSITVERSGAHMDFTLTRASIEFPNLRANLRPDRLGYIRLISFARGAGDQLRDEVQRLSEQGADGVVLDMRDNGGGLFSEAIDVASIFIEDGIITTYRAPSEDDIRYEAEGDAFEELPVVVLVNGRTASASEIVAGALQDSERAIVVGSTTYGKGSVQEVIPLPDASALKLTTAAYLTPNGKDINGEGIEPDVEVASDVPGQQKERAVEILKGIVLSGGGAQG